MDSFLGFGRSDAICEPTGFQLVVMVDVYRLWEKLLSCIGSAGKNFGGTEIPPGVATTELQPWIARMTRRAQEQFL